MDKDLCIFNCGRVSRARGVECRNCYQRLFMERKREREYDRTDRIPMNLSLEQAENLLERKSYNDWYGTQ